MVLFMRHGHHGHGRFNGPKNHGVDLGDFQAHNPFYQANKYPLVILHSHGKWPIEIDGLPIKNGDSPWLC